jgi:hypothetical protein
MSLGSGSRHSGSDSPADECPLSEPEPDIPHEQMRVATISVAERRGATRVHHLLGAAMI